MKVIKVSKDKDMQLSEQEVERMSYIAQCNGCLTRYNAEDRANNKECPKCKGNSFAYNTRKELEKYKGNRNILREADRMGNI